MYREPPGTAGIRGRAYTRKVEMHNLLPLGSRGSSCVFRVPPSQTPSNTRKEDNMESIPDALEAVVVEEFVDAAD